MPQTPHGINFAACRPVIMGRNGKVCSGHPLTSQAGIATAAALNVVEPVNPREATQVGPRKIREG